MESHSHCIETNPNKGIMHHDIQSYLANLVRQHVKVTDRALGIWIVRTASLPLLFDSNLLRVNWDDYDTMSVLANVVHLGNSDGPDHPVPIPWASSVNIAAHPERQAQTWQERKKYSCAELIARIFELDALETFQWIPSSLFVKLSTLPGSACFRLDTSEIETSIRNETRPSC
jgi:hypothetical protein